MNEGLGHFAFAKRRSVFRRPGSDLLFRVLRRSTIAAGAIYGRVRDGIGYGHFAKATRPAKNTVSEWGIASGELNNPAPQDSSLVSHSNCTGQLLARED